MSAVERTRAAYRSIAAAGRPEIWVTLREEADAVAEAERVDRRTAAGERLPLAGLVAAVKDNIDVAGLPTTAGARSYSYEPAEDATAVARLRAAGAVVLGKANLDQFATGLVGTRSPFGAVRNAWDPERISGGSSSGSAVAVALGLVDIALGTDTAGSGRVPAALNGVVGLKPTRGLIPATGVVPACRSLDCVSVFARSLELACEVEVLLSGPDGRDPLAREWPAVAIAGGATPRVAIPLDSQLAGMADGWAEAFAAVASALAAAGVDVVPIDIAPLLDVSALLYGGAYVAERYAAVGAHIAAHPELIGSDLDPTVAGIVLAGAGPSAAELFADAERLDVLAARSRDLLAGFDALLTPTTTWHPTLDQVAADPVGANSRMGRFTNFANLLDLSALAVPAGSVDGLPFGVMLTGPAFHDRSLAALAVRLHRAPVDLFVVGAHLAGHVLHHELLAAGATLVGAADTTADYRLFALNTVPAKPGLVRVDTDGGPVRGEVWRLPVDGFGAFVASLSRPMSIGTVTLTDGRAVKGFLCEPAATSGARDITQHGSWSAWLDTASAAV
jgi:allophanate hydrolase